ncbi:MAG: ATP synthase subunit C [Candidatus Heimdallarchaeota archaeon]
MTINKKMYNLEVMLINHKTAKRIFLLLQLTILVFGLVCVAKLAVAMNENPEVSIFRSSNPGSNPLSLNADDNTTDMNPGLIAIGAGLAIGLAGTGAGIGLGPAAAAAAAAMIEKPESFGKLLVLLALIEAVAIYGFVIAFVLIGNM